MERRLAHTNAMNALARKGDDVLKGRKSPQSAVNDGTDLRGDNGYVYV